MQAQGTALSSLQRRRISGEGDGEPAVRADATGRTADLIAQGVDLGQRQRSIRWHQDRDLDEARASGLGEIAAIVKKRRPSRPTRY